VAGFIGSPSMNFFSGRLVSESKGPMVQSADFAIALPADHADRLAPHVGRDLVLGVRPEDLALRPLRQSDAAQARVNGHFSAKVDVVETLGSEKLVHLVHAEQRFVARTRPHAPLQVGDEVLVQARPTLIHLFDPVSGDALN
jgi:multiple sugar transport system ATP-binding protein